VFERYQARHIELARSDEDGAVQILAQGTLAQGTPADGNLAQVTDAPPAAAPPATLTLERYRTAHHRYWMDQ
jgi:competence protein ComEC